MKPSNNRKTKCYNCGFDRHVLKECKEPCGICGKTSHHVYDCIKNPRSSKYVPIAQRNGGRYKGKGLMATETSEPGPMDEEEGYANMANAEVYHPLRARDMDPINEDSDEESGELNPPDCWLPFTGIASDAYVLCQDEAMYTKWILDGGASHHFTHVKAVLHNYKHDDPSCPYMVKVANKQYAIRVGVGTIKVETVVDGKSYDYSIHEVWHMPTFAHSLLSANKLKSERNWRFSGTEGDMNEYFVNNESTKMYG
jgi:hypothetical protein